MIGAIDTETERVAKYAANQIELLEMALDRAEKKAIQIGIAAFILGFMIGCEFILRKIP